MKTMKRVPRCVPHRGRGKFMPLTLLTLAMGCGGPELAVEESSPERSGETVAAESCQTMLHEDTDFSRALERDPDVLQQAEQTGQIQGIACLQQGSHARPDLERLGFSASEPGSIDVSNGYRATAFFADGSTRVYVDSRAQLRGQEKGPELLSVKVEWCPVSVALEGQTDAEALCLDKGESRLETLKTGSAAAVRELRVAPGYELELEGTDGVRYHASRTVSDGKRLSAIRQPASVARARVSHVGDAVDSGVSAASGARIDLTPPEVPAQDVSAEAIVVVGSGEPLANLKRVVIFGDSLSDQGRMYSNSYKKIPNPHHGYWNGRFANGHNWVDYLLRDYPVLSTKIDNRAVGGSEARRDLSLGRISLMTQASRYVDDLRRAGQLSMIGSSLFVLWGGANDVLNHVSPHWYNGDWSSFDPSEDPYNFALIIRNAMLEAHATISIAGSGSYGGMLFIDLPDISTVPIARYDSWASDKKSWIKEVTRIYNNQLLAPVVPNLRKARVLQVDAFIQNWNQNRYSSPFMSDRTNSCYVGAAHTPSWTYSYVDKPCASKMYFDKLHPTSLAQCGIAGEVAGALYGLYATKRVYDRAARISTCAQRRQSPVRAFWRDAVVAPLGGQAGADAVCPGACTSLGTTLNERMTWNRQWRNLGSTSLCGCVSESIQPVPLKRTNLVSGVTTQAGAERACPASCASYFLGSPTGMFWDRTWSQVGTSATCNCTSFPR